MASSCAAKASARPAAGPASPFDPASLRLLTAAGDPVAVLEVPGVGTWSAAPDGTVRFVPAVGYAGTATAGYRVDEVLNGEDVTVTGRTDQVTGSFTVAAGALTAGEVAVDLASVSTDSDRRDEAFREVVGAGAHPTSTFTLT